MYETKLKTFEGSGVLRVKIAGAFKMGTHKRHERHLTSLTWKRDGVSFALTFTTLTDDKT